MARKATERKEKMVTRTFIKTTVTAMVFNVQTESIEELTVEMVGEYKDKALTKELEYTCSVYGAKVLKVINTTYDEILYGMPESVFIQNAEVLPPRNSKEVAVCES